MKSFLPDKVYDFLTFVAQILLPAIGTLYFTLTKLWGWPYGTEVVGTLAAVAVFLGVVLGISDIQYNKIKQEINK